jgi:hypothetical protein
MTDHQQPAEEPAAEEELEDENAELLPDREVLTVLGTPGELPPPQLQPTDL